MSKVSTLLLLIFLSSCASEPDLTDSPRWSQASNWTLIEINYSEVKQANIVTLRFDHKDQSIHGYTGCNRIFGSYSLQRDRFTALKLGMTKRFCAGGLGELERRVIKQLSTAERIRMINGRLIISGPFGSLTLLPGDPDAA